MAKRQVLCITKPDRNNPHTRITHIGGDWGTNGQRIKITETEAINDILHKVHYYFVQIGFNEVEVKVEYREGQPYLKTYPDNTKKDNLLNLRDCG